MFQCRIIILITPKFDNVVTLPLHTWLYMYVVKNHLSETIFLSKVWRAVTCMERSIIPSYNDHLY